MPLSRRKPISRYVCLLRQYKSVRAKKLQFGAALGLIKDEMQPPDLNTVTNEIDTLLNVTITGIESAAVQINAAIFNDPDTLYGLIQFGAFFSDGGIDVTTSSTFTNAFDVERTVTEALFANALPLAWYGQTPHLSETFYPLTIYLQVYGNLRVGPLHRVSRLAQSVSRLISLIVLQDW